MSRFLLIRFYRFSPPPPRPPLSLTLCRIFGLCVLSTIYVQCDARIGPRILSGFMFVFIFIFLLLLSVRSLSLLVCWGRALGTSSSPSVFGAFWCFMRHALVFAFSHLICWGSQCQQFMTAGLSGAIISYTLSRSFHAYYIIHAGNVL